MTADRYKPICPRAAWHVNSEGFCELEEKSPKRRKKLSLFSWKSLLQPFSRELEEFVRCVIHAGAAVRTPPQGRGMPRCSKLASSRVHGEAFQATQLLTALQLFFHAVLLYIALLSLPGGTAVLQYNRLAKCKTDFFHLPNTNWLLLLQSFMHIQEISVLCLLFSLLPCLLLLPSLWCSSVLSRGQPSSAASPRCHWS